MASALSLPAKLLRTASAVHPDATVKDTLARVKYFVRGLCSPSLTAGWFDLLDSGKLRSLVQSHPHILSKVQRPYLHRRLSRRDSLEALKHHYRFVEEHLPDPVRLKVFSREGFTLAVLPGLENNRFQLRLHYDDRFEKEGDLSVDLYDGQLRAPLFTLTFCAHQFPAGEAGELFIGGLQGHVVEGQRELVIGITRSLHGLRPKALLVFAIQRLAQLWGFTHIKAVGEREHVYQLYPKYKRVRASYDEFWLESGGWAAGDGNFQLPAAPTVRNLAELPTNKRPVYRRRYAMLEQLGQEIHARLHGRTPLSPQPLRSREKPAADLA